MTACSCATGTPGPTAPRTTCSSVHRRRRLARRAGLGHQGLRRRHPLQAVRRRERVHLHARRPAVVFSARVAGQTEPWSTNFDLYRTNGLTGDGLHQPDRRQRRLGHRPGLLAGRPDPGLSRHGPPGLRGGPLRRSCCGTWPPARSARSPPTGTARPTACNGPRTAAPSTSPPATSVRPQLFAIDARNGAVVPITGEGHVSAFDQTPLGLRLRAGQPDPPARALSSRPSAVARCRAASPT